MYVSFKYLLCVSLVLGTPFGNPECVRIFFTASEENLLEIILRIKNQLSKLNDL